jgi:ferritin-like metal-binding protein YciE
MAGACDSEELSDALMDHLAETESQVARLEKVFQLLGTPVSEMKGLLEEGSEAIEDKDDSPSRDLAIVGAAQRFKHYEISAYGTARALAEQIGNSQVARLLLQTENEEKAADEKLSEIAKAIYASDGAWIGRNGRGWKRPGTP